jgi:hypothetical protein
MGDKRIVSRGGGPFFAAKVFNDLKMPCGVVSKVGRSFGSGLSGLKYVNAEGISYGANTTTIEIWEGTQISASIRDFTGRINYSNIPRRFLNPCAFLVSTVSEEVDAHLLERIKSRTDSLIALDIQGYLRPRISGKGIIVLKESQKKLRRSAMYAIENADILKCNEIEFGAIGSPKIGVKDKLRYISRMGPGIILVTLGKDGALLYFDGKLVRVKPIKKFAHSNTVGAGDKFFSLFLAKFVATRDPIKSVKFANRRIIKYLRLSEIHV